jgi:hypothetical protein
MKNGTDSEKENIMFHKIPDTSALTDIFKRTVYSAEYQKPSFYRQGAILKLETRRGEEFFVVNGSRFIKLKGHATELREANKLGGLKITNKNVANYCAFFCNFLRDPEGNPFRLEEVPAPKFVGRGQRGRLVDAFSYFEVELYKGRYEVWSSGYVRSSNDCPG